MKLNIVEMGAAEPGRAMWPLIIPSPNFQFDNNEFLIEWSVRSLLNSNRCSLLNNWCMCTSKNLCYWLWKFKPMWHFVFSSHANLALMEILGLQARCGLQVEAMLNPKGRISATAGVCHGCSLCRLGQLLVPHRTGDVQWDSSGWYLCLGGSPQGTDSPGQVCLLMSAPWSRDGADPRPGLSSHCLFH